MKSAAVKLEVHSNAKDSKLQTQDLTLKAPQLQPLIEFKTPYPCCKHEKLQGQKITLKPNSKTRTQGIKLNAVELQTQITNSKPQPNSGSL